MTKCSLFVLALLVLRARTLLHPSPFGIGRATKTASPTTGIYHWSCHSRQSSTGLSLHMTKTASTSVDSQEREKMKLVRGIRDIIDDYDVWILDMWGVMHDGFNPYEGVIDVVKKLKEAGKTLIILSNSSQRKEKSIRNLKGLGFDPLYDFDQVITSGEVAFHLLSGADINDSIVGFEPWSAVTQILQNTRDKKPRVFVLGSGTEDESYCNDSGWELAPVDQADLILARGTFSVNDGSIEINKREDPEGYEAAIFDNVQKAAVKKIPMIVSNPDKVRPDYERPPMPGKLGDLYEAELIRLGSTPEQAESLVKRIGKPFRDVYDIALRNTPDRSRACMVGDALETDVTGGSTVGIDTVWILRDGVYAPEFDAAEKDGTPLMEAASSVIKDFNMDKENTYAKRLPDQLPTVSMPHFRW